MRKIKSKNDYALRKHAFDSALACYRNLNTVRVERYELWGRMCRFGLRGEATSD